MRRNNWIFDIGLFLLVAVPCHAQALKIWTFDRNSDREGWSVPERLTGAVMGGSLWLTMNPTEKDPTKLSDQMYQLYGSTEYLRRVLARPKGAPIPEPDRPTVDIVSPGGLKIPVSSQSKEQFRLRMRVLNLSPATDFFFKWRTSEDKDDLWSSKQCAIKPDLMAWQEVRCFLSKQWEGVIDQIAVGFSPLVIRGDIWIDSIEIGSGVEEPLPARPDVASVHVVPRISVPGISQADFAEAFKVLDDSIELDVPAYGFPYPFMGCAPGCAPRKLGTGTTEEAKAWWWVIDTLINTQAASWANAGFSENVMRGFHEAQKQNPDGRISGYDWEPIRGQVGDLSMQPLFFFEAAFEISRRTKDVALRENIYETMRRYLDWWLSPVKRNRSTGLVTGTWEEVLFPVSDDDYVGESFVQTRAPVSLNVGVAVSASYTAKIARALGKNDEADRYNAASLELSESINKYLWDEEDGAYYDMDLRSGQRMKYLTAATFFPFCLSIAPKKRQERLIRLLTDPAQFNFGKTALTGIRMGSRRSPFASIVGSASVYMLTNLPIVTGLKESGNVPIAAKLNWSVIETFGNPFPGGVEPDKKPQGGRFGFSAAGHILSVIETLFGVEVDSINKKLRIAPYVPQELYGKEIALSDLILPTGGDARLSVKVKQDSAKVAQISLAISGELPEGDLEIMLPGSDKTITVPVQPSYTANFQ